MSSNLPKNFLRYVLGIRQGIKNIPGCGNKGHMSEL